MPSLRGLRVECMRFEVSSLGLEPFWVGIQGLRVYIKAQDIERN